MHDRFKLFTSVFSITLFLLLVAMLTVITYKSIPILSREGVSFVLTNVWRAPEGNPEAEKYGIAAALWGTFYTSSLAIIFSLPLSTSTAIFVNEFAPEKMRELLSTVLDVMACLPTVIYGLWGMKVLAPFIRDHVAFPISRIFGWIPYLATYSPSGHCIFTAAVVLAAMITPYTTAIIRESYAMVPFTYREAIWSLGATRTEAIRLLIGMVKPAIVSATALGFGRAIGETIAVSMTVGNAFNMSLSPFAPGYTVSSLLASQFGNAFTYGYMSSALYGATLVMLAIGMGSTTLGVYIASRWVKKYGIRF